MFNGPLIKGNLALPTRARNAHQSDTHAAGSSACRCRWALAGSSKVAFVLGEGSVGHGATVLFVRRPYG